MVFDHHEEDDEGGDDDEGVGVGAPADFFEAGVADIADHEHGESEHGACEDEFPCAEVAVGFVEVDDEVGEGGDESCGHGDGEAAEVGAGFGGLGECGDAVEAGEADGTAEDIDAGEGPADVVERE